MWLLGQPEQAFSLTCLVLERWQCVCLAAGERGLQLGVCGGFDVISSMLRFCFVTCDFQDVGRSEAGLQCDLYVGLACV